MPLQISANDPIRLPWDFGFDCLGQREVRQEFRYPDGKISGPLCPRELVEDADRLIQ